jgi:hypothetical protein
MTGFLMSLEMQAIAHAPIRGATRRGQPANEANRFANRYRFPAGEQFKTNAH